jgi:hypothetical protein
MAFVGGRVARMPRTSTPTGRLSMPKIGGGMKPTMKTKKVGGIRTNFTQGIATPKLGKR